MLDWIIGVMGTKWRRALIHGLPCCEDLNLLEMQFFLGYISEAFFVGSFAGARWGGSG